MALGVTIVEVIIKNISRRKMMSVIEAMLNVVDILFLRFMLTGIKIKSKTYNGEIPVLISYS